MVLPEYIINEESDECSVDSLNSDDDDNYSDDSENCDDSFIPKGSLQGSIDIILFLIYCLLIYDLF